MRIFTVLGSVLFTLAITACGGGSGGSNDAKDQAQAKSFKFSDTHPDHYQRVDRMGMPAVATVLITTKDAYNQATPQDDANGDFLPQIEQTITGLHAALDDDLTSLGFDPATTGESLAQGGPLIIPDVINVDATLPLTFPNGRALPDPVIDLTLAAILLDLGADGQGITSFADIPLNPPSNDKPFLNDFPYLAPPFQP